MIGKLTLGGIIAAGTMMASIVSSSAMPVVPQTGAPSAIVQKVAWGCGPGWHPNPWGRCVPNRYRRWHRPVIIYRTHHHWRDHWHHHHYWHHHHHWRD